MTCIAACKQKDGSVIVCSDRGSLWGSRKDILTTPKIFQRNEFTYGVSGTSRLGEVLQRVFNEPPMIEGQSILNYLTGAWSISWRECLQYNGLKVIERNEDLQMGDILLIHKGRIFTIAGNFSVRESGNYEAIGSGQGPAIGAFFAIHSENPQAASEIAVKAAINHAYGCDGPIDTLHVKCHS